MLNPRQRSNQAIRTPLLPFHQYTRYNRPQPPSIGIRFHGSGQSFGTFTLHGMLLIRYGLPPCHDAHNLNDCWPPSLMTRS